MHLQHRQPRLPNPPPPLDTPGAGQVGKVEVVGFAVPSRDCPFATAPFRDLVANVAKSGARVTIPPDLAEWLDDYADRNGDGLTSRKLVAEDAIRFYRQVHDPLGLPKEARHALGLAPGETPKVVVENAQVRLRKR